VLDEDDYVMLEEAGFHRPPRLDNNKKFKRLKKAGHITGEKGSGSIGLSDGEDGGVWQRHTAEEQLKRSLFGDDEGRVPKEANVVYFRLPMQCFTDMRYITHGSF
jgi:hypothetical protein